MAMLAGARSLHARSWERRYGHAFGGWFERGRLNLRAGEEPFSEIPGISPRSPGSHKVSQWANSEMRVHWNQAKKCKGMVVEEFTGLGTFCPKRNSDSFCSSWYPTPVVPPPSTVASYNDTCS